jgi:hypothetical protein
MTLWVRSGEIGQSHTLWLLREATHMYSLCENREVRLNK